MALQHTALVSSGSQINLPEAASHTPPCDSVVADALLAKVRELLRERIEQTVARAEDSGPIRVQERSHGSAR